MTFGPGLDRHCHVAYAARYVEGYGTVLAEVSGAQKYIDAQTVFAYSRLP